MSQLVVDTDVASYVFNLHPLGIQYEFVFRQSRVFLSFMSVAELRMGAFKANRGARRVQLLERYIGGFEVVYADNDLCTVWATVRADALLRGRQISPQDAWVAATALVLDAPLATNNRRDFEHVPRLRLFTA